MREKAIEQKLCAAVRRQGGVALKLSSSSYAGLPDRLILMPGGHIGFMEIKAPGKKPRALQVRRHEQLRRLGFRVYVVDSAERIGEILEDIQKGPPFYLRGSGESGRRGGPKDMVGGKDGNGNGLSG